MSNVALPFRAAAARLTPKLRLRRAMLLPPVPKWSHATDDIDGADFCRRSEDFERSLLPADLVFPRAGQIWEAVCDCQVTVAVMPLCNGRLMRFQNECIRQGQRVRVLELNHPKPLTIRFRRLDALADGPAPEGPPGELSLRTAPLVPLPGRKAATFTEVFRLVEDIA